jgi:hypothetical protein
MRVRRGLKKFRIAQITQYPTAIPNTNAATIVDSSRKDSRTVFMVYILRMRASLSRMPLCSSSATIMSRG